MESKNLADLYGLPLIDWDHVEARLEKGVSQAPSDWRAGSTHLLARHDQP